jgi:hypothetical protein
VTEHSDSAQFKNIVSGFGPLSPEAESDIHTMGHVEKTHRALHAGIEKSHSDITQIYDLVNNIATPPDVRMAAAKLGDKILSTVHGKLKTVASDKNMRFMTDHHPDWGINCTYPGCSKPKIRWPWADD